MSRAFVIVMLGALLVGCGGGDDDTESGSGSSSSQTNTPTADTTTEPSTDPSDGSSPVRRGEAAEALKRGIRQIAQLPFVGFRHSITALGISIVTTDGVWVPRRRWVSITTTEDPDTGEDYVMHAVSVGRQTWMQMEGWPGEEAGCWLSMSGTQVPVGITGLTPGIPSYFSLLPYLRPRGFDPDDPSVIVADTRLDYASTLFPVRVAQIIEHEVDDPSQERIEITVSLGKDGIEGYGLSGGTLIDVIAEAKSEDVSGTAEAAIGTTNFRVDFSSKAEDPGPISAPHPELRATGDEGGCR